MKKHLNHLCLRELRWEQTAAGMGAPAHRVTELVKDLLCSRSFAAQPQGALLPTPQCHGEGSCSTWGRGAFGRQSYAA